MSSNIQVAALSDVGCVRTNNEDNFGYDPENDLYVVCDGMGGMAAGEVASAIACSTVITVFAAQPAETPIVDRLALAIRAANDAVCHSGQLAEHKGMGTTLVCAALQGSKLLVGNVGDSRAYLFQGGACMQVTLDHSYVNELVRAGTIKIEDIHSVELEQFASVITRAIGAAHDVEPDFFFIDLHEGDALLLASDGLTRYVEGNSIAELVDPSNLELSCQNLINKAKAAGGADNITCILLRYDNPKEATAEAPTETAADGPAETATEAPAETTAEAVAEPATDTPAEASPDAPEEIAAEASVEDKEDVPAEEHAEAPVDAAGEVTLDFLAGSTPDSPAETAAEASAEITAEAPAEADENVPAEAHAEAPAETPTDAATEVTLDFLAGTASDTPVETADTPAATPEVPQLHVPVEK